MIQLMEKNRPEISQDLQHFIEKFEPRRYKLMAKGIEIRGVNDIHRNIGFAKEIIDNLELKLVIAHNAEMLSYRCFEVNNMEISATQVMV